MFAVSGGVGNALEREAYRMFASYMASITSSQVWSCSWVYCANFSGLHLISPAQNFGALCSLVALHHRQNV